MSKNNSKSVHQVVTSFQQNAEDTGDTAFDKITHCRKFENLRSKFHEEQNQFLPRPLCQGCFNFDLNFSDTVSVNRLFRK